MTGLSWFAFYPRDWAADTRELSDRAKGCYIDLLGAMYTHGGPLPFNEQDLTAICGYRNVRSFRLTFGELVRKEKLHLVDGFVVNNRAMEEIDKAKDRSEGSAKGGRARKSARNRADIDAKSKPFHNKNNALTTSNSHLTFTVPNGTGPKAGADEAVQHDLLDIPSYRVRRSQDPEAHRPALDLRARVFGDCRALLIDRFGFADREARSFLGSLRKDHADAAIIEAFASLEAKPDIQEPRSWLTACLASDGRRYSGKGAMVPDRPLNSFERAMRAWLVAKGKAEQAGTPVPPKPQASDYQEAA